MGALLRDVVVVGRLRPQSMPLPMPLPLLSMKQEMNGFYFYACMWFCSYGYGAPLSWHPAMSPSFVQTKRSYISNRIRKNMPAVTQRQSQRPVVL